RRRDSVKGFFGVLDRTLYRRCRYVESGELAHEFRSVPLYRIGLDRVHQPKRKAIQGAAVVAPHHRQVVDRMGKPRDRTEHYRLTGIGHAPNGRGKGFWVIDDVVGVFVELNPVLQPDRFASQLHTLSGECEPALCAPEKRSFPAKDPFGIGTVDQSQEIGTKTVELISKLLDITSKLLGKQANDLPIPSAQDLGHREERFNITASSHGDKQAFHWTAGAFKPSGIGGGTILVN